MNYSLTPEDLKHVKVLGSHLGDKFTIDVVMYISMTFGNFKLMMATNVCLFIYATRKFVFSSILSKTKKKDRC